MSDHYPVCLVQKYRGIKSAKSSHDKIILKIWIIMILLLTFTMLHAVFLIDMFDDINEKLDTW